MSALINVHAKKIKRHHYKTRKRGLEATLQLIDWERAIAYFGDGCAVCRRRFSLVYHPASITLDHWVSMGRGGGTTADNTLPLCHECNDSKADREAVEWLTDRYGQAEAEHIAARIDTYFQWVRGGSR